jgi:DivIVA domain-containing protein
VDRDAIERRDFPVGRRGYDQAAVDEHLRRVADQVERLAAAPPSSLAAGASEQVRQILEAAESSAAELRADAGRRAADHVARVQQAGEAMLARIDELGSLLDGLRESGERLNEGLLRLRRQAGELGAGDSAVAPDDGGAASPPDGGAVQPAADDGAASPHGDDVAAAAAANGAATDEAGARLIALNMALSGTPREETARYLAERFELPDPDALLADVYERAVR